MYGNNRNQRYLRNCFVQILLLEQKKKVSEILHDMLQVTQLGNDWAESQICFFNII